MATRCSSDQQPDRAPRLRRASRDVTVNPSRDHARGVLPHVLVVHAPFRLQRARLIALAKTAPKN